MLTSIGQNLPEDCISDLQFDQWRCNELDVAATRRLEQHLEQCERCSRRRQVLATDAQQFLARYPVLKLPTRARVPRLDARRKWIWNWSAAAVGLAAAAAVTLVLRSHDDIPSETDASDTVRTKGTARVGFHVKHGQKVVLGSDGQEVYPGDQLRFFVSTPKPQQLAILSLDARSSVSEYYPGNGQSRSIGVVSNHELESSVVLDAQLGNEQIWGIFCDAPFAVERFRQALTSQGRLPELPGCSVDTLHIVKKAAAP